ncbi:ejaculatory bulb-specific protein 3-like [Trichogramma pretiosum]|uniref:ejaculatory bulb-specific protein 3-like n=1 Tax=Trichogramma pretiosum TaxID=7493 RepID=UPI0006C9DDDA|nr:ejaculatory bulb-specific protein 3-like [Trichogramma pretiosum]
MANRFVLALVLCTLVAGCLADEEKYSDKYDYIDVDNILSNERIRNQYFNCFLDYAPCLTADAKFFRDHFPEALVTKCKKCTEKQKEAFEKLVLYYTEKEPEKWRLALTKAIEDSGKKRAKN